jgi:hypothetical protein
MSLAQFPGGLVAVADAGTLLCLKDAATNAPAMKFYRTKTAN